MFRKIVIGVDENDETQDAIALARVLAAPDAKFTLVNVYPEDRHPTNALDPVSYPAEQPLIGGSPVNPYRSKATSPTDDQMRYEDSRRLLERIAFQPISTPPFGVFRHQGPERASVESQNRSTRI